MVNNILEKSFIFGAMLFSIAYNSDTLGMGSSPEEHNTNNFNTIADNKSINSSILTDSSSQIKMRFGKKDKDKDWIQVTMPIYNLKFDDKTGQRSGFLDTNNISDIGIFDIDLKNTAVILERGPFVVKLNVGGVLKYELLDTIKTQASRFMNYVNGEIDEYKDLSRISRTEYEHKYDVTTCITMPGLQIDYNIKKPALNIYNEKFVVQRNFLDRFLSFGEKFKVNFSKSLGFYSNDIFAENLKNDRVLFKFKGPSNNIIDMKGDVNLSMLYNMFYMNLMNVLTDFSIGRLQVDLNIFHTKLRKKIITKYFKYNDGKPININEDIIDDYYNTKTYVCSATNFSLYCKLSNEGDESNNWINYDIELSGIFNVKYSVNFEKFLILPRKPKDYEDFIQNIKPLKSYDDHQPLIYKDSNRELKVYFNGVFSLKRIEFLHNNVAFAISLVDFSFGIHSQGHIQQGDFSVFNVKQKDASIFAIYVRPFIIKMELIKDGIIVVNWTPFTWGNRLDKNDMQFSKNLKASLNLNKLYHWIFGKENVV